MAIRWFTLLFDPPRTDPPQDSARAHIALGSCLREKEQILVSPECRTAGEVEAAASRLKADLDRVVAEARRKFKRKVTREV